MSPRRNRPRRGTKAGHVVAVDGRGVAVVAPGEPGCLVRQVPPDELDLLGVVVVVGNDDFH
jgi:hypothetical protein